MGSTVSTLLDSHHILHPREENHEIGARNEPTIFRRILGVVLVALSIPFTLGIATGLYIYWAHRKVKYIEERDYSELQARTNKVFGEMIQSEAPSSEQVQFEAALKAIQQGGKIQQLPEEYDKRAIALLDAALAYDNTSAVTALMLKYEDSVNDIHLANVKSVKMLHAILERVPEGEERENLLNKKDGEGNTALHLQKNLSIIEELVKKGAKFSGNSLELSPLHTCQDPKIAKYFIDRFKGEMDILNLSNDDVPAPIFTVPPAVVRVLIEEGANVKARDLKGNTILFRFTEKPFSSDPQLLEWILSKIENADEKKDFICLVCQEHSILNKLIQSDQANVDIVKVLLNAGARYPKLQKGDSPLQYVKVPEVAACLIDHYGEDIMERKNKDGVSPLIQARSNLEVFKIMIDKGVKVTEARDKDESTILAYFSVEPLKNHPELIHTILEKIEDTDEKKAFVNHKDTKGLAALNYGLHPLQVVQALIEAGSDASPGVRALKTCKDPELARYLMEKFGNQFNEKLTKGVLSPLFVSKKDGSIALSELCSLENMNLSN
ncbi:hypothetical protein [Waddlia chondrophila]|uniref:Uncharacterized protein n=1 Tax=Waddlia chondrophila (strain ATCC VR-1470 / WSU 86-1044) TaxID=716544 RepID=D6YSN9_WADCW|nr:hypothetical protein [Waddlia chondrophila]ADI39084.1 hypothetical protein wcw_1743 [Waddlia chondrophila WSU 86-1044]